MNKVITLSIIAAYTLLIFLISWLTSRKSGNKEFFTASRNAKWYLVAYGMIGAMLSGVTFISVPGTVENQQFAYLQLVLGNFVGYLVVAYVLLPLYYKMKLVSIYEYLKERFGKVSYQTGASFFLLSRTIGASFRLYLVAGALQLFIFDDLKIPFSLTIAMILGVIWLYTYRGGIKTVVWTDTLQTTFILGAVITTIYLLQDDFNELWSDTYQSIRPHSQVFFTDMTIPHNFYKQFFAGVFMAIAMIGLDQDMMQKNLTCKNIKEGQKNMVSFGATAVVVNMFFLVLGALLVVFAQKNGVSLSDTDKLYPTIVKNHLGIGAGILFLLGTLAAAYSSADSALTSLTTSFCVDFLGFSTETQGKNNTRHYVHIGFTVLLFVLVLVFKEINNDNIVTALFKAAGYTYGPLLGLYFIGIFTAINPKDHLVPLVCIVSPLICYGLNLLALEGYLGGYRFGFEILIINGVFTAIGLAFIHQKK